MPKKIARSLNLHPEPRKSWSATFILPGIAILIWLVAEGAAVVSQSSISDATNSRGIAPGLHWYFQSGQWRADARSLVAAAQYFFEPEPAVSGDLPGGKIGAPGFAASNLVTNTDKGRASTPL